MNVPVMSAEMPRWVTWINEVNIFHVLADLFVDRRQAEQGSFYVALEIITKSAPLEAHTCH